jgi:tryptophan synthase alpha subunit
VAAEAEAVVVGSALVKRMATAGKRMELIKIVKVVKFLPQAIK